MRAIKEIAAAGALVAATAALSFGATTARADSDPDNVVRIGLYAVMYHATATDISGPFTPTGLNVSAKNVNTVYIGYIRRLSDHWVAELALGAPPVAPVAGKGPVAVGSVPYDGRELAHVRWLAPSVLVEYMFLDPSSSWRPYVGVGVNYTTFYDRQVTASGQQITGGPTKLSMTSSVGPAGTVGITWKPWGPLELNLSYSASLVNSTITTDTAGILRTTRVQFNPTPLVFSIGYRF